MRHDVRFLLGHDDLDDDLGDDLGDVHADNLDFDLDRDDDLDDHLGMLQREPAARRVVRRYQQD